MRPKVIFLGNCQAQAFQSLSGHLRLDIDVLIAPAIWKITDSDRAGLEKQLQAADFIFSQRVREDFPQEFLRNANLKNRYGEKTVVWPNIYFDGYFPGIQYIYMVGGKVEGPLGDYHFDWIHRGWEGKRSVEETALIPQSLSAWSGRKDFSEASIQELRHRERAVDVRIGDYIVENFRSKKLFHSMNHPDTSVLIEMMKRLFAFVGLAFKKAEHQSYLYHLNQIEVPAFPIFRERYWPTFEKTSAFKGYGLDVETNKPTADVLYYGWEELVCVYYALYDRVFPAP